MTKTEKPTSPRVSVIIPTYGHRAYIEETLASVFSQSYQHIEVIVVNDGSPDDVAEILRPLAEAERISYVEQSNQGQSAARNVGLQMATGDFIAFLDDDDVWPSDKLDVQVAFLLNHPEAVGVAGTHTTDWQQPSASREIPYVNLNSSRLFCGNPIWSPGQALLRADVLRRIGGFDESVRGAEDYDLWIRMQKLGALYFGGSLALYYRLHSQNTSKNVELMFTATSRVLEKHLAERPLREHLRLRRLAYRFLDSYKGKEFRQLLLFQIRNGEFRLFWKLLLQSRAYWLSHLVDPKLALRRLFR